MKPHDEGDSDLPKGIGNPTRNALAHVGIVTLEGVAQRTEAEILALHGVGSKAIAVLRVALADKGLSFKEGRQA